MLDHQEIRELVAEHGLAVNEGRSIRQLIDDGEIPRLEGCTVLKGKVSDSVFGDALTQKICAGNWQRFLRENLPR